VRLFRRFLNGVLRSSQLVLGGWGVTYLRAAFAGIVLGKFLNIFSCDLWYPSWLLCSEFITDSFGIHRDLFK
jgi:hypothetical protein